MNNFVGEQQEKLHKKKFATLKDVAKLAGVGTGSVSRYLNNDKSIKDSNRQKIADAIRELKFVPNNMARKLASGSSRNILLLLVSETPILMSTWMHSKSIVQEIYEALLNSGYTLQLALVSTKKPDDVYNTIKMNINTKSVDAVMILSYWEVESKNISFLMKNEIPYVLIGCKNHKNNTNEILQDNYGAFKMILDYLVALKHKKIALLSGNIEHEHMIERLQSYKDGMSGYKFKLHPEYIQYGEYSMDSGYKITLDLIKKCRSNFPTAIMCGDDEIACGAIKALKEHHFRIPDEVSITGFDNIATGEAIEPTLTTIQAPDGMGKMATIKLLDMLKSGTFETESSIFPCELIVRKSAVNAND